MRYGHAIPILLLAAFAALPAEAGAGRGAGWYRVVQWVAEDGLVLEEFIDSRGPFPEKKACQKGIDTRDPDYVTFCKYFTSDPVLVGDFRFAQAARARSASGGR